MNATHRIRCGDTVKHRPSGEVWMVAYADEQRNELSWFGWPDGVARLSDCELVDACSNEEHASRVREAVAAKVGNRSSQAARLYADVLAEGGRS